MIFASLFSLFWEAHAATFYDLRTALSLQARSSQFHTCRVNSSACSGAPFLGHATVLRAIVHAAMLRMTTRSFLRALCATMAASSAARPPAQTVAQVSVTPPSSATRAPSRLLHSCGALRGVTSSSSRWLRSTVLPPVQLPSRQRDVHFTQRTLHALTLQCRACLKRGTSARVKQ